MTVAASTRDVTNFLSFLIKLSIVFEVDEETGYVVNSETQDKVVRSGHPLIVYREKAPPENVHVINPFPESYKDTEGKKFLYQCQRNALMARILTAAEIIIRRAVLEKSLVGLKASEQKKKLDAAGEAPPCVTKFASEIVSENLDEKMIGEFQAFKKYVSDASQINGLLLFIDYSKKMMTAKLSIPLIENPEAYQAPPTKDVRKNSLHVFRKTLMVILGLKTEDELSEKYMGEAHPEASSRIDSICRCLFSVYSRINRLLDDIDPDLSINLTELKEHISNMPLYTLNARSMVMIPKEPVKKPQNQGLDVSALEAPNVSRHMPSGHQGPKRFELPNTITPAMMSGANRGAPAPTYGYDGPSMTDPYVATNRPSVMSSDVSNVNWNALLNPPAAGNLLGGGGGGNWSALGAGPSGGRLSSLNAPVNTSTGAGLRSPWSVGRR